MKKPLGYSVDELERDSPYNQWMYDRSDKDEYGGDEYDDPDDPDSEGGYCSNCSGSGEGQYDGTNCYVCKGTGEHK
jgi:hypothetical protein